MLKKRLEKLIKCLFIFATLFLFISLALCLLTVVIMFPTTITFSWHSLRIRVDTSSLPPPGYSSPDSFSLSLFSFSSGVSITLQVRKSKNEEKLPCRGYGWWRVKIFMKCSTSFSLPVTQDLLLMLFIVLSFCCLSIFLYMRHLNVKKSPYSCDSRWQSEPEPGDKRREETRSWHERGE